MSESNNREILIEKLHQLIEEKKEVDRISWNDMGKLIGYSGVGLKKALNIRSLSITKLQEIIIKLDLINQAEKIGLEISKDKKFEIKRSSKDDIWGGLHDLIIENDDDLKKLESLCLSNWEALMKRENFKNKLELTTMKDINKILDERLAIILKNINN